MKDFQETNGDQDYKTESFGTGWTTVPSKI